jgi:hypothetical protein
MDNTRKYTLGVAALIVTALLALVLSASPESAPAASLAGYEPPCAVKNPPFVPRFYAANRIEAQINNRCTGTVYELGGYGCLQASRGPVGPWRNVNCEAGRKRVTNNFTLFVYASCYPNSFYMWHWRIQGYVWVDYDVAPGSRVYQSLQVTSPVTPSVCSPA